MRAAIVLLLPIAACSAYTPPPECPTGARAETALNGPSLAAQVWDDGQNSYFRFPGQSRIPTFYVVNPDGKEAVTDYTVDPAHDQVVVHQTAAEFKLRDGAEVACIFNHAYNPVGYSPGTGTITDNVVREPGVKIAR
jgi:type IV secretory pathway VirB9-like protein